MNEELSIEQELVRLAGMRLVRPEEAQARFQSLLSKHPGDKDVIAEYAWFLYDTGDLEKATEYARRAIALDDAMFSPRFNLGFTLTRMGRYEEAIEEFVKLFERSDPRYIPESPYMYFNFLLMLKSGFQYEESARLLDRIIAGHPLLGANGTDVHLRKLNESRMKQIYLLNNTVSGFLLFIDLVSSTQYKHDFPERWQERIVHFLMYTKYALKTVDFDFIKFIGDEVMMFRPFDGKKSRSRIAQDIYGFVGSHQKWYSSEVNRFNPALNGVDDSVDNPHRIKVKITLGEVTGAKVFFPYYNEMYDLIGEDVDRIARIKELGYEDLVIADQGFVSALSENGPAFTDVFSEMVWQQKFKGIKEKVKFYGKLLSP
jgi:tetratricopeptide (TPR) repeat protein